MKLLGTGELSTKLTIKVHAISASAREKVEAAGGSVELLREPKERKRKHHHAAPAAEAESAAEEVETATDEPESTES